MKWKNVARLISVDIKSGRLLRSREFRKYRERKYVTYMLYIGAIIIGIIIALIAINVYAAVPEMFKSSMYQGFSVFLSSLPSTIFIYSFVLTLMGQIQKAGIKVSIQPPYWLPVTWSEHTLASVIAILLGIPLASLLLIGTAVFLLSIYLGQVQLAVFTILASFGSAFIASTTTEIFRVLQTRLVGAVYKSSGKAAIWIRFLGSMAFLAVFYIVWFMLTSGSIAALGAISDLQKLIWFVPYVWLGMALYSFSYGQIMNSFVFSIASIFFIMSLFYVAVKFNTRYGLYEPPSITISHGAYSPKTGLLQKLGFSSVETAIMSKDFKAFFRRKELMYVFIMPIVFIIVPLMQLLSPRPSNTPSMSPDFFFSAWLLLLPGSMMAVMMGEIIIGEEGSAVWHYFSSPVSAGSLFKCKYLLVTLISLLIGAICAIIGIVAFQPSLKVIAVSIFESIVLTLTLAMVAIESGIRGADFVEIPRPRMIRTGTALSSFVICLVVGAVIVAPLLPHLAVKMGILIPLAPFDITISLAASGIIAFIISYAFYRLTLKRVRAFLANAEA